MQRVVLNGLKFAIVALMALCGLVAQDSRAANVQYVGSVGYS